MDIVKLAFKLADVVTIFSKRARKLYFAVMLLGNVCPRCNGRLTMTAESMCRCGSCGHEFDPTPAFQRCQACGGAPELHVRRYQCNDCGADIASRFVFDGLVFDAEYFRQKMAESRQRKKERREKVRKLLANSRSPALDTPGAIDLQAVPGLLEALNGLTDGLQTGLSIQPRDGFDLKRYQRHLQAHIRDFPTSLEAIPPLGENARKDRIWRFVAIIFMAHFGLVDIWQDGQNIMVMRRDVDTKGQDIHGDIEGAGRLAGSLGGIEA